MYKDLEELIGAQLLVSALWTSAGSSSRVWMKLF